MGRTNEDNSKNHKDGEPKSETFQVDPDDLYSNLRYNIMPPLFLVCFTLITQILVVIGNPNLGFGFGFIFNFLTGLFSMFAWKGKFNSHSFEEKWHFNVKVCI